MPERGLDRPNVHAELIRRGDRVVHDLERLPGRGERDGVDDGFGRDVAGPVAPRQEGPAAGGHPVVAVVRRVKEAVAVRGASRGSDADAGRVSNVKPTAASGALDRAGIAKRPDHGAEPIDG